MSKKSEFLKYANEVFKNSKIEMNEDAKAYWIGLQAGDSTEKPVITDNGKLVLQWLQQNPNTNQVGYKAKEIANNLLISPRTVAGTMRKLTNDGFVEKLGQEPIIYSITQKGKDFKIN